MCTSPVSQTVVSGSSVTFSASASGSPAPTVQWQQSTNGTTYTNITGATSTSYTISAVTTSQNGYRYRAVFTNSVGSATTAAATSDRAIRADGDNESEQQDRQRRANRHLDRGGHAAIPRRPSSGR